MHKAIATTCLTALFVSGCAAHAGPATWLDDPDAVVVGMPPLAFIASQPGRLVVIDTTTRSKIFFFDVTESAVSPPVMFRLDEKRKAFVAVSSAATQPSVEGTEELVAIDPTHHFVVQFRPATDRTGPTTRP